MNEISITIQLDIHASGDALVGRATPNASDVKPVEFNSWIGLVAAIDTLVEGAKQNATSPASTS